ncbi:hypothetical protein VaNZ11_005515, partial [Volvox africanus]
LVRQHARSPRVPSASALREIVDEINRSNTHESDGRLSVKSLTLHELQQWFVAQGERPSRADQIWRWLYGNSGSRRSVVTSPKPSIRESSKSSPASGSGLNLERRVSNGCGDAAADGERGFGAPAGRPGFEGVCGLLTGTAGPTGIMYFGGGLRCLTDAAEPAVDGFSAAFVTRFSSRLSFNGGLQLEEVTPSLDGTRKLVFRVTSGAAAGGRIETVLIPWYRDYDPRVGRQEQPRYTLCVSSQVGCAMNCQFCFTGRQGLLGNLTTAQIIEQVLVAQQLLEDAAIRRPPATAPSPGPAGPGAGPLLAAAPITNLVFMGMGEPLHNCPAVFAALDILTHRRGLCMSASRITLSTVGLLPQLQHFLDQYGPPAAAAAHFTSFTPSAPPSVPAPGMCSSRQLQTPRVDMGSAVAVAEEEGAAATTSSSASTTSPRISLAVSIHAGTDQLRAALVPSNRRLMLSTTPSSSDIVHGVVAAAAEVANMFPLEDATGDGGGGGGDGTLRGLSALCAVLSRHYPRTDRRPLKAGRYVLFEYTMLGGVNDRVEDAAALLRVTRHIECSFNLIMFNPFPGTMYVPSTPERVREFLGVLRSGGRIVHVRHSKGDSSMAACGQLGDVGPRGTGRVAAKILPEAPALAAAVTASVVAKVK